MRAFVTIWLGQVVSMLGTGLTAFALGIWVFQRTGSATLFSLIFLVGTLPEILVSPFAGALVDRWNRRTVMLTADTVAVFATIVLAALLYADQLEIWHIYIAAGVGSVSKAFQGPAYTASVALLVPEKHLGRVGGMLQFGMGGAQMVAPLIAAPLVMTIGLPGILLIDCTTYLFSVGALLLVRIPRPAPAPAHAGAKPSLLREAAYGWSYIAARPALLGTLVLFAITNLGLGMVQVLMPPFILSFASVQVLGVITSAVGVGILAGSLVMSTWGGPKRRMHGILGGTLLMGACLVLAGVSPWVPLLVVAFFAVFFSVPIVIASSQVLWLTRVPPHLHGRVLATCNVIATSTLPVTYLASGWLADRVFNPLLLPGGALAPTVGAVIGVGPGRGIGLMLMLMGTVMLVATVVAILIPGMRGIEDAQPEHTPAESCPATQEGAPSEAMGALV